MLKKQLVIVISILFLLGFASVAEANQWLGGNLNMPSAVAQCDIYTPNRGITNILT